MNLHAQIMNLPVQPGVQHSWNYMDGHRDARHAAAELALQADALNAELLAALSDLLEAADSMRATYGCIQGRHPEEDDTHIHEKWPESFLQERADTARAAIAKATAQGAQA